MTNAARARHQDISTDVSPTSSPIALVVVETSRLGNRFFRVLQCPFCGRADHRHSVPVDWQPGDPPGHRVADCATGLRCGAGYEIVEAPEGRS